MDIRLLASNLKRVRVARRPKLTQVALGEMAKVDSSYISKLESGKIREPSYEYLSRIARALDVPLSALTGEAAPAGPAGMAPPDTGAEAARGEPDHVREDLAEIRRLLDRVSRGVSPETSRDFHSSSPPRAATIGQEREQRSGDSAAAPGGDPWRVAPVHELRVSADATRHLLYDDASERLTGGAPYPVGVMISTNNRVTAFRVEGDCLLPMIRSGQTVYVESLPDGTPWVDLDMAVNRAVFAEVEEAIHVKVLRRNGVGFKLAPTNGEVSIPVDERVRIRGVVIWVGFEPTF